MDEKLMAALAGAGATLLAVLLKDIVVPIVVSFRAAKKEELDAIEKYAEPLAVAAYSLFFRLHEILESKRASFLLTESSPSKFHTYKYRSSIYRFAGVLGWIWALKKEKSLLLDKDRANERSVYKSIAALESAFADGPHVEAAILRELCSLWRIRADDVAGKGIFDQVAAQIDSVLDNHLYDSQTSTEWDINNVPRDKQKAICSEIAELVANSFSTPTPSAKLIGETLNRSVQILSPKQAWIFRDWQNAIGQLMMLEISSPVRMFDIIGFSEFDELFEKKNKWILELDSMLKDLRPAMNDPSDYRIEQLWTIYEALSHMIVTLKGIRLKKQIISDELLREARRVTALREAQRSSRPISVK